MIIKKSFVILLTISLMVFMVACSSSPENNGNEANVTNENSLKVALVTSSGGLGDRSFNDTAWAGFQKAEEELGVEVKVVEPTSVVDYQTQLRSMAEAGYKLVAGIGFDMKDAVSQVAPQYPDTYFVTVNVVVDEPNVAVIQFKDHEGSFLAGALAGLKTETNIIGFVGGADAPNIRRFW